MIDRGVQIRHSVTYGAIFGGIIVLLLFLAFLFGMMNVTKITSWAMPIYVIGVYIAVKHYRDRINNGYVQFWTAFGSALIVCIVMGILWAVYRYILFKYLSPEIMIREIEEYEEGLLKLGFSENMVELSTSAMTPFSLSFGYITNSLIYGSILSLVVATLLKRKTNPLLEDTDQN